MKICLVPGLWCKESVLNSLSDKLGLSGIESVCFEPERSEGEGFYKRLSQLQQFVEANDIKYLVGHSLGGLLVAKLANRLPGQFKKIIILSPAQPQGVSFRSFPFFNLTQLRCYIWNAPLLDQDWILPPKRFFEKLFFNQHEFLELRWNYDLDFVSEPRNLVKDVVTPTIPLHQITCPTMVMIGYQDLAVSPRAVKKFCQKFLSSVPIIFGADDHMSLLQNRQAGEAIVRYLKNAE